MVDSLCLKNYFKKLPKEIQDLIYLASEIAFQNDTSVYLVGGFVRDLILGVKNLDLDITVEGSGINLAQSLAHILKAKLICHKRFGTATLFLRRNLKVDIASSRKEIYPQPASLPCVSPGTLKDDLGRRDFTINAMAINIQKKKFGKLIDFFGGKADLRSKKIRILHPLSFIDDPTRILRAVRFEQRYQFRIEPKTLDYLKRAIRLKVLQKVQPQRLRDELILILKEQKPLKAIRRLEVLAGVGFLHRRLSLSKATRKFLGAIENEVSWFIKTYSQRRRLDAWLIYFMGMTDPLNKSEITAVCEKLGFYRGDKKRILSYKKLNRKFISELSQFALKPSEIFRLLEPLSYEVTILLKAKYTNRNLHRHISDFLEIYNGMRPEIRGDDLRRLGVAPGPRYRKIFINVLKAKLEGKVRTKEEELALIDKLITRK